MTWYSIRQLANEFGLTLRAIRFYEQRGLLQSARTSQTANAKRIYDEDDRVRLAEIVNLTKMGFTLSEISSGNISAEQYKHQLAFCLHKIEGLEQAVVLIKERLHKT